MSSRTFRYIFHTSRKEITFALQNFELTMRRFLSFEASTPDRLKKQLLARSLKENPFFYLENRQTKEFRKDPMTYSSLDCMVGIGAIDEIWGAEKGAFDLVKEFSDKHKEWLLGFWGYDLKNDIEKLSSENFDGVQLPSYFFFVPRYVFFFQGKHVQVGYLSDYDDKTSAAKFVEQILEEDICFLHTSKVNFRQRISRSAYIEKVKTIQDHIQRGDIYEANFCQEFYDPDADIHPAQSFIHLRDVSPAPFMSYMRLNDKFLISASPERFLKRVENKLIAQPMKGTGKRSSDLEEDKANKLILRNDKKERAENTMIVDLVRNDLTKISKRRSVRVEELCGVYSFKQVHQMISTVSAKVEPETHFTDIIKANFPMGSMTGAPKIRAMEIIEQQEETLRGLYSGAVGYVSPNQDFDFNVIIRSLLYNASSKYLSLQVGSAITSLAKPENEHEECLLKAEALRKIFD